MKRYAAPLLLVALTLLWPSAAVAQDRAWSDLEAQIRTYFEVAKLRWGVSDAEAIFPPDGIIRTFPKNEGEGVPPVSFPQEAVRERLAGLDLAKQDIYLRWMVAHELWHRRQYEQNHEKLPATLSVAQRECEADVMGTAFATETQLATLSPDQSDASQNEVREALIEIRDAVDPGSREAGADPEYPSLDQRQLATQLGINLALLKRLEEPARSGDQSAQAAASMLRGAAMMEEADVGIWVSAACGRVVHSGSGVPIVRFGSPILDWNKSGDDPVVGFSIPVFTKGTGRVRGFYRAMTTLVRRTDSENTLYWLGIDYKDFNFELSESEGIQFLRGSLSWAPAPSLGIVITPGSEYMPRFVVPGTQGKTVGSLFNAERIWPAAASPQGTGPHSSLATFVASLTDAALQDFASLPCDYGSRGPPVPAASRQPVAAEGRCKLLDVPSDFFRGVRVGRAGHSGARLVFDVSTLENAAQARGEFNRILGEIRAQFPGAEITTEALIGDNPSEFDRTLVITNVPYLELQLSISNLADPGEPPEFAISMSVRRD